MPVQITEEMHKTFMDNGFTEDDIANTVNHYRQQGQSDEEITNNLTNKYKTLQGAIISPEMQENGEIKETYNYPSEHLEKGRVTKRGWLHPVDFAKSIIKGGIRGQTGFVAPITDRLENLGRRALGLRPLTEYEQENNRAKVIGRKEDGGAYNVGKFIGETAPYFVLPETKLAGLGKWGNRALTYGYQGGLGGGLSSIAEKGLNPVENLKDAAIGAGGAIVLGGALAKGGDKLARMQRANAVAKRRAIPLSERMTAEQKENAYINRGINKRLEELKANPELVNDENFYKGVENLSDEDAVKFFDEVDVLRNENKISELKGKRTENQNLKAEKLAQIEAERQEALKGAHFRNPSSKINEKYDKLKRQAQIEYNQTDRDLADEIKSLKTNNDEISLSKLKEDIGSVKYNPDEITHSYNIHRKKGYYSKSLVEDDVTYNIKEAQKEFNNIVAEIKKNPEKINDEMFMANLEQRFNKTTENLPDYVNEEFNSKLTDLTKKARAYTDFKYGVPENVEINPTRAMNENGEYTSKFIDTVKGSDLADESIKGANATYKTISNKETLSKAQSIIDEDLQGSINKVLTTDRPSEVEIAMGEDLVRRLQATGNEKDTELAIQILEKTASDLTKAGRTVQAARIWQALTPEGALMSYQKAIRQNTPPHLLDVLDNARGIINKVKTAETSEDAEKILRDSLKELNPNAKNKIVKELKNAYEKGEVNTENLENAIKKHFKIQTMTDADRVELNQLAENIQNAQTDREREIATALLKRKIEEVTPASLGRKVSTVQAAAQLLNDVTINRNLLGNTGYGLLEDATQSGIAPIIDKIASKFTGERSVMPTNPKTQIKGLLRGAKLGLEDLKYGIDTSAGANKYDLWGGRTFRGGGNTDRTRLIDVLFSDNKAEGLGNYFKDLLPKSRLGQALSGDIGALKKIPSDFGNTLENAMNLALRVPDRAAYTAVYDEAIENMLRANGVKNVTREMIENAPQHIKDQANLEALQRTFQDDSLLAQAGQSIKRWSNKIPMLNIDKDWGLGDIFLKYAKTPSNILQRGIDYSPLGLIGHGYLDIVQPMIKKSLPFNQRQAVMNLSRGLMGTGLFTGGAVAKSLFPELRGEREDKTKLQQNLYALGLAPYTIPIGDRSYSYDWAVPTSIPFSGGVNLKNGQGFAESVLGSMNTLTEQPLLSGLQSLVGGGFKNMPESVIEKSMGVANSFVPALLRQTAQTVDPYVRETRDNTPGLEGTLKTEYNLLKSKIPYWSKTLPMKYDVTGQPITREENIGLRAFNNFISPAKVYKHSNNSTLNKSMEMYNETGQAGALYPVAPKSVTINKENIKLSNKQMSEYKEKLGKITDSIRSNMLADENFANLSTEEQISEFEKYNKAINSAIKYRMFGAEPRQYKSLVNDILEYYDEY